MKTSYLTSLLLVALVVVTVPASAATIHVPGEEPSIQACLDAASAGDTVLVECGTYYEHDITMKSGVCLTSETSQPECVTIDALHGGRVIYCSGVDSTTTIRGVTIQNGFSGYDPGGGVYCEASSPLIVDVRFSGNVAYSDGGGMYCVDSAPTLRSVVFSENEAHAEHDGGGLYCSSSAARLTAVAFTGNTAANDGGGMYCISCSPMTLTHVTFTDNPSQGGGGLHCAGSSPLTLTDVTFVGNAASRDGGMYCTHCTQTSSFALTQAVFEGNQGGGSSRLVSSPGWTQHATTNVCPGGPGIGD
ncbi:MAG: hypothetical protein ABIE42_03985 [Candidatus Eisenbacteria bacterium]